MQGSQSSSVGFIELRSSHKEQVILLKSILTIEGESTLLLRLGLHNYWRNVVAGVCTGLVLAVALLLPRDLCFPIAKSPCCTVPN